MFWNGHEYVWVLVTNDEYELPLAVFDSATELARFAGTTLGSVTSSYYHWSKGHIKTSRFRRVMICD